MSQTVDQLQWIENALYQILLQSIAEPFMIDVGAHHGTSIEPFLNAGWRGIAFEPMEHNRKCMAQRLAHMAGLEIRSEAVSDRTSTKEMQTALHIDGTIHEFHHSFEEFCTDPWHTKGPKIQIPAVSLDDLVHRGEIPQRIGFLKVDTEGHDIWVLRGASRIACEVVSVEFWNDEHAFGASHSPAAEIEQLLKDRGFEQFIAITHFLDQTEIFYSTLNGIRPEAWGNLIFFHKSRGDLYENIRRDPYWKMVVLQSQTTDQLKMQLREKQAVIEQLADVASQRLKVIEQLSGVAAERLKLIEQLSDVAAERLKIIEQGSRSAPRQARHWLPWRN